MGSHGGISAISLAFRSELLLCNAGMPWSHCPSYRCVSLCVRLIVLAFSLCDRTAKRDKRDRWGGIGKWPQVGIKQGSLWTPVPTRVSF